MSKLTCVVIAACFASTQFFVSIASAQQAPQRYTGGWSASNPEAPTTALRDATASPVVQAAYYQSPGTGLPPLPNSNAALPAANFGGPGYAGQNYGEPSVLPPSIPSMPNALQNSLQNPQQPPQPFQQPAAGLNQAAQANSFDPYATSNQVLPPSNPNSNPYRNVAASDNLRAVQNPTSNTNQSNNNPSDGLRPVAPTMPSGFGPNSRPIDIATGYPFVSPAPARVGNYPTSAYNPSLFRTVAYQNVVQAPLQPAPLSANIANTQPTLPQFQNAPTAVGPGVYPTQYQCAPTTIIPTYPPPGAVPGTYVPPTITPNLAPGTYSPNNSGYSPLFSLGQENYNVQIGRGIIGQPTVYVPGQPFRNFFRYLSP